QFALAAFAGRYPKTRHGYDDAMARERCGSTGFRIEGWPTTSINVARHPNLALAESGYAYFTFLMRNLRDGMPLSLAGSLLVAHPNMLDPNFRRAVLFIYE